MLLLTNGNASYARMIHVEELPDVKELAKTLGLTHQLPKTSTARGIEVCRIKLADVFSSQLCEACCFFGEKGASKQHFLTIKWLQV